MVTIDTFPRLARVSAHAARSLPQEPYAQRLLVLAALPLLDGVAASTLAAGGLAGPLAAIGFGLGAFSGPGCIAEAISLPGSRRQRAGTVLAIYLKFVLPGAIVLAAVAATVRQAVLPSFELFSALILFGLAADQARRAFARRSETVAPAPTETRVGAAEESPAVLADRPISVATPWRAAGRALLEPPVVLGVALAASLLRIVQDPPPLELTASPEMLRGATIAALAGLALTLAATLLGGIVRRRIPRPAVRLGGALSLVAIALTILEHPLFPAAPLAALLGALAIGALWRLKHPVRPDEDPWKGE